MDEWLTPRMLDGILVGVAVEFVALGAVLVRASATRWIAPLFLFLTSGALLLAALRGALAGAEELWLSAALLASGLAHAGALWTVYRALGRGAGA